MRKAIAQSIETCAQKDDSVFVITGDAGYGVLDDYQNRYADRFLNLGVAEQNMIGFAAGLSLTGHKVFVYNIAPFVLYRCYEQVRNDICYQRLPVTLIGIGCGLAYAPGGMTHYAIEDIALAKTLPNLVVLSPGDPWEARASLEFAYKTDQPVYIRIPKTGEPDIHPGPVLNIAQPQVIRNGGNVAVLFHGAVASSVLEAVEMSPFQPTVVSVPMLSPLDVSRLSEILANVYSIITVEEHYTYGGLGTMIADWMARTGASWRLKCLGIHNEFVHVIRKQQGMWDYYEISADAISRTIGQVWTENEKAENNNKTVRVV